MEDLPVSHYLSMGIHESQSLLWERMVGLSLPFWHYAWPKVEAAFPDLAAKKKTPEGRLRGGLVESIDAHELQMCTVASTWFRRRSFALRLTSSPTRFVRPVSTF